MKWLMFLFVIVIILNYCGVKKELRQGVFNLEEELKRATKLIEDEEYEKARQLLIEIKNRDFNRKYAPLAQLKLAESYLKEDKPDVAVQYYKQFLRLYPEHPYASYAQYRIGMVYFNQIQAPDKGAVGAKKAMAEFQKLLKDYPRNPYREIAKLKIKKCRNIIAEYEFLVGKFYYKKGSYKAAINRFKGIIDNFKDYKNMPEVLYLIAISYKKIGNFTESNRYFKELINKFHNTKPAKKAQKELVSSQK